jgi:hypothetical protein
MPESKPLFTFESGARVRRLEARPVDFAFDRVGTVVREFEDGKHRCGVRWDGDQRNFEYPGYYLFAAALRYPCHLSTNATNPFPACGVMPALDDSVVLPLTPFDPVALQITCPECAAIYLARPRD